ncbi:MAG TPA: hypothetical protein VK171_09685, partial [Fimbriimonas sp.]|nr:hypothetical protein [Fimbriimonas sp.]
MSSRLGQSKTTKHEVSERTLEVVVGMAITLVLGSIAYYVERQWATVAFTLVFACVTFVQGRILNRNVLVHVPFVVAIGLTSFWLGLAMVVSGTLLTSLASQRNLRRFASVTVGELVALGVVSGILGRTVPELWLLGGLVFVLIRSLISVMFASKTGAALDFAAISGGWALVAGLVYASTGSAVHFFERIEITQSVVLCFGVLAICYLATAHGFQRAREDFQKGIAGLSGLLNYSHTYTGSHSRRQ